MGIFVSVLRLIRRSGGYGNFRLKWDPSLRFPKLRILPPKFTHTLYSNSSIATPITLDMYLESPLQSLTSYQQWLECMFAHNGSRVLWDAAEAEAAHEQQVSVFGRNSN